MIELRELLGMTGKYEGDKYSGKFQGFPTIRGHHLYNFQLIYEKAERAGISIPRDGISTICPNEQEQIVALIKGSIQSSTGLAKGSFISDEVSKFLGINYKQDVAGFTKKDGSAFDRRNLEVYRHYFSYPANQVIFLTTLPDAICRACHIGEHCKRNNEDSDDIERINAFEKYATTHSIGIIRASNILIGTEMGYVRDFISAEIVASKQRVQQMIEKHRQLQEAGELPEGFPRLKEVE